MDAPDNVVLRSVQPHRWYGLQIYVATSQDGKTAFLKLDHDGWNASAYLHDIHDRAVPVCSDRSDLLEAGRKAIAALGSRTAFEQVERSRREALQRAAQRWRQLIERGAAGKGVRGTESTGEALVTELAATLLPGRMPALSLLDRFSIDELKEIKTAMRDMGQEGWYYPLLDRT